MSDYNTIEDNPKNLWLCDNLQNQAHNVYSDVMSFDTDFQLLFQELSELMVLRKFTIDGLMNIPEETAEKYGR